MKIVAVYNIKGGVGKTATAVNLAYLSARDCSWTLLCDLDPQGAASFYFRTRADRKFNCRKLLKGRKSIDEHIKGSDHPYLDILPADLSFRNLDIKLDGMKKSKQQLKRSLAPLAAEYETIILDSPPNMTLLSENIFNAADVILVPLIPTTLSMVTFEKLMEFFKERNYKQKKLLCFFSMVEKRKKMHRQTMEKYQGNKRFLSSIIPYTTVIERMGVTRNPVNYTSPNSPAARSYTTLWNELKTHG